MKRHHETFDVCRCQDFSELGDMVFLCLHFRSADCLSVIHSHSLFVMLYGTLGKPNYSVYIGYQREGRITVTQPFIMSGKTA